MIFRLFYLMYLVFRYRIWFLLAVFPNKFYFFFKIFYHKSSMDKNMINLIEFLEKSGPVFIKLGQIFSTRYDIFDKNTINHFAKLTDFVKSQNFVDIKPLIEKELNRKIEDIFDEFLEIEIGSGSLAQVYKAKIKNQKNFVAVKILRKDIQNKVQQDIKLMKLFAKILEKIFLEAKRMKFLMVVNKLEKILKLEMDLRFESSFNMEIKRETTNISFYEVPNVYSKYTTKNLMITEFIDGVSLLNKNKLIQYNINKKIALENIIYVFFYQMFVVGVFHGDFHPGNILIKKNNTIATIDHAILEILNVKTRKAVLELFLAFLNKNYKRAAEIHFENGWIDDKYDVDEFAIACSAILEGVFEKDSLDISIGDLISQLFYITKMYNMKTQEDLILIQKNLLILEGIGRELYPEINMWVLGKNIIEKIDKDYNLSLKYTTEIFKNTIKNGYQKLLNFNGNKNAVNIVNYKKEFSTLIFYIKLIVIALFMLLCVLFLK